MRRKVPMKMRRWHVGVVMVVALALVTVAGAQDKKPSGTVTLESRSIAAGVGVSWGDGTLMFENKEHKFSIKGLSVVDLGVSKVTAKGDVYDLTKLSDFSGTYVAAQIGATIAGGAGAVAMKNQNGVTMVLTGTGMGAQLTLAGKGVDVKLIK
jgi:predicted anti-sigma-YlaC factor YlaD